MIASFDIGEVNFAYCIGTLERIHVLKHVNIKKRTRQTVVESCCAISAILEQENFSECTKVIIEQQIMANSRAQRLGQHVWTWFSILHPRLMPEFVSSSIKTNRNLTYRQRKQEAVKSLRTVLEERGDTERLAYINSLPKQDDVADAYVQLVAFIQRK